MMDEKKNHIEDTEKILEEVPAADEDVLTREEEPKKEDTSYCYGERAGHDPVQETGFRESGEEMDTTPLTLGDWLLTLLAGFIPCCGGIILYCYWAFAKRGNLHRRNFCRAALIIQAVLTVLLLIFFVLVVVVGSVSYGATTGGYYYYGY